MGVKSEAAAVVDVVVSCETFSLVAGTCSVLVSVAEGAVEESREARTESKTSFSDIDDSSLPPGGRVL